MCTHVPSAVVKIRAPCCNKWYYCSTCHDEASDHKFEVEKEMVFQCRKCDKVFKLDLEALDNSDCTCPFCKSEFMQCDDVPESSNALRCDDSNDKE